MANAPDHKKIYASALEFFFVRTGNVQQQWCRVTNRAQRSRQTREKNYCEDIKKIIFSCAEYFCRIVLPFLYSEFAHEKKVFLLSESRRRENSKRIFFRETLIVQCNFAVLLSSCELGFLFMHT